jgi:hypothetical protein
MLAGAQKPMDLEVLRNLFEGGQIPGHILVVGLHCAATDLEQLGIAPQPLNLA